MDLKNYFNDLSTGYFEDVDKKIMKLNFLDTYSKELADLFVSKQDKQKQLSTTSARAVFESLNSVNKQVINKRISFREAQNKLAILTSRINDKYEKGVVSADFKNFFEKNFKAITTIEDINAFCLHFESICNYLKKDSSDDYKKNSFNKSNFYMKKN